MKTATYEDVLGADAALRDAQSRYLRRFGWWESSDNPASYWLWEKRLDDGRVVMANRDLALAFTAAGLDPTADEDDGPAHDEEDDDDDD